MLPVCSNHELASCRHASRFRRSRTRGVSERAGPRQGPWPEEAGGWRASEWRGKGRQVHRTANYISEGKKRAVRKNRKKVRRRARTHVREGERGGKSRERRGRGRIVALKERGGRKAVGGGGKGRVDGRKDRRDIAEEESDGEYLERKGARRAS